TFSNAVGLPAGLSMDASGNITGTPTAFGTFTFTFTVKDANGKTATGSCSIVINPPPVVPTCGTVTGNVGTVNVAYTAAVSATGRRSSALTFSNAVGLPAGLSMDAAGKITGTPTAFGTFTF